ncbi:MAG: hypothetical protein COU31_01895 [Candidatus Magasanikbacteria bacterium CG10_big_fil_rev_8_21_14_0_10_40_10]|uniref:Solute-binding protein family 5 domain-containing protein n=1 Tax=Candidatus Magasanikbacteria bacterium CG10_big_fil_rev_8_21_14_0_10_40_10 TaxID=1974648 RepID=A0A2M6W4G7_9BACT|nr:MAG: hypothetical protein COU31_01895 [Candidatus Magasanikbacteria bacterium CG10_big_fil_rev_8_21_14_0_10_40_10]
MNFKKRLDSLIHRPKKPVDDSLDKILLKKTRQRFLPNYSQIKYLRHFLSKKEKWAIGISVSVLAVSLIAWASVYVYHNQKIVPANGGEYSEGLIGQPKYVNPLFSNTNDIDADLTYLIYSGLFKFGSQQKLLPELASKYIVSADKKTYDINLREDVKWSDGREFTADDVVFTFNTIKNPLVSSPLVSTFQGVEVKKVDKYQVRFTLKEPFAPFLTSLTVGIIPAHIWSEVEPAKIKLAKNNLQPVGTGAWVFNKMIKDQAGNIQQYILQSNPNYYKKPPYLDKITFKFYPDYTTAFSALKTQEIMGLSFVPNNLKKQISNKNFIAYNFNLPQYTALFLNEDNNDSLADEDLRLALWQAVNKTSLAKNLDESIKLIDSPLLGYFTDTTTTFKYPAFNTASSTELLDDNWEKIQPEEYFKLRYDELLSKQEAEIKAITENPSSTPEMVSSSVKKIEDQITESVRKTMDAKQSAYRKDDDDNILELTITTVNNDEYGLVAKEIASMWANVGIKTNIRLIDSPQIPEVIKNRNYEILLYSEIVGADLDPFAFWHSSQSRYPGLNLSGYSNSKADELLEDARGLATETERQSLYARFVNLLIQDIPAIFLYTPNQTFIIDKQIHGIDLNNIFTPSQRYITINDWYIKTQKKLFGN